MDELITLAAALLLAHLLADFVFQTRSMVEAKASKGYRSYQLYAHALIAGLLAWLLAGLFSGLWALHQLFWVTALTHLLIDAGKIALQQRCKPERETALFFTDQLLHLLVVAGLLVWITGTGAIAQLAAAADLRALTLIILTVVFLLKPCSVIMQKLLALFPAVLEGAGTAADAELPLAGQWIGFGERILILIFVLLNQFGAIGFLIGAKSILRFGSEQKQGPKSEYVLLGTLFSFTIAILAALALKALL